MHYDVVELECNVAHHRSERRRTSNAYPGQQASTLIAGSFRTSLDTTVGRNYAPQSAERLSFLNLLIMTTSRSFQLSAARAKGYAASSIADDRELRRASCMKGLRSDLQ